MFAPEGSPAPIATAAAVAPRTAIGIGAREFSLAVYRPRVRRGPLKLNVRNLGEDLHDLVVRRNGHTFATLAPIKPGTTGTLRLTLRTPGRYQLICTVADHATRGMRATLRIVR
jgi:hypothetical protein